MRVGINKARQDSLIRAINLFDLALMLPQPRMAQDLALLPCNDDAATGAEDRSVFDQSEIIEFGASSRGIRSAKREKLGDVCEKKHLPLMLLIFHWDFHTGFFRKRFRLFVSGIYVAD